jgi:hypothetical protein
LVWINSGTGTSASISIGNLPVYLLRDRSDPSLFYIASSTRQETPGETPLGLNIEDKLRGPQKLGNLYKIKNGAVLAQTTLDFEPDTISQSGDGYLCLTGMNKFLETDANLKTIAGIPFDMEIRDLLLDGNTAYLSCVNNGNLVVVDLQKGVRTGTVKINHSLFGPLDFKKVLNVTPDYRLGQTILPDDKYTKCRSNIW